MKKLKIIGTLALVSVLIGQRFLALPDLAFGLGYGIAIGTLILSCIPKEKYEQIKSSRKIYLQDSLYVMSITQPTYTKILRRFSFAKNVLKQVSSW